MYFPVLKSEIIFENPVNQDVAYTSVIFYGVVCPVLCTDRVMSSVCLHPMC